MTYTPEVLEQRIEDALSKAAHHVSIPAALLLALLDLYRVQRTKLVEALADYAEARALCGELRREREALRAELEALRSDAALLASFEQLYIRLDDGSIVLSLDGQAHLPVDPVAVLNAQAAEILAMHAKLTPAYEVRPEYGDSTV